MTGPRVNIFALFAIAILSLVILPHSLMQKTVLDEDQFVAAAYLMRDHLLYRDYLYFQPPIYPLLVGSIGNWLAPEQLFLFARLTSWAMASGCTLLMYLIGLRLTERQTIALGLAGLFALSPFLMASFGSVRNDIMPIFFGLSGVALCLNGLASDRWAGRLLLLSGVALALAVGTKLSAAFIPLVVTVYVISRREGRPWNEHIRTRILPLVLGGMLGALPILYYAVQAPDNFLYDVFLFHLSEAPTRWYRFLGRPETLEPGMVLHIVLSILFQDPGMLAAFAVTLLGLATALAGRLWHDLHRALDARNGYLVLALLAAGFVLSAQPVPHLVHYFMPVGPYLLLSGAVFVNWLVDRYQDRLAHFRIIALAGAVCLAIGLTLSPQVRTLAQEVATVRNSEQWVPSMVRNAALAIRRELANRKAIGPIATLNPLYVIEAGLPLMPAFASSIFLYRTADQDDPALILQVKGIAPGLLDTVLGSNPPAAVLIGHEIEDLSRPMIGWAQEQGYKEVNSPGPGLRLFLP